MELPLITIKIFHEGLGIQEITAFNAYSYDKQEKLIKLMNACKDKSSFLLTAKSQREVIFKLTEGNYAINYDQNRVTFYMPAEDNKQKVRITAPLTDELLEKLANCNGLTYLKVKLDGLVNTKGNAIIAKAKRVTFYRADYDLKTAEELLKEYKPIDLLMLSLGYKPTKEAIAVTLPRLLTLFKYFDSYKITGIHVASFQQKGTGKTTTFNMLENLANAYYCEKIPTEAKLIGDARLGTYGIVKRADIVAIDEFDKIAGTDKDSFAVIFPILLTGMEQGVFKREVSSKRELEIKKAISFCFMGNSEDEDLTKFGLAEKLTAVEVLENILRASVKNANITAFLDRLIYVEFLRESYQIRRDINLNSDGLTQFLHPKVARGVIKLLREQFLKRFNVGYAKDRTDRSVKVLTALLKLLQLDELAKDQGVIEELVMGKATFWDYLVNNSSISSAEAEAKAGDKPEEEKELEDYSFNLEDMLTDNSEDNSLDNESSDMEYVTVKITANGNRSMEIIGADGKEYVIKAGEIVKLPKENAEVLIRAGVAEEVIE